MGTLGSKMPAVREFDRVTRSQEIDAEQEHLTVFIKLEQQPETLR